MRGEREGRGRGGEEEGGLGRGVNERRKGGGEGGESKEGGRKSGRIEGFVKQKKAKEMEDGDWSSDVCSSDLIKRLPMKSF